MNTINIPTVDVTDLPPSQENPVLKFIERHYVLQHLIGIGMTVIVIFFIIAPLLVGLLFPYFGIMKSYDRVITCSNLAENASNAALFQPVQCTALTGKSVIGCSVATNGIFIAPNNATSHQKTLCPQLIASTLADGTTNTSVPVLSTSEATIKLQAALATTLTVILLYISTRAIIYFVGRTS